MSALDEYFNSLPIDPAEELNLLRAFIEGIEARRWRRTKNPFCNEKLAKEWERGRGWLDFVINEAKGEQVLEIMRKGKIPKIIGEDEDRAKFTLKY